MTYVRYSPGHHAEGNLTFNRFPAQRNEAGQWSTVVAISLPADSGVASAKVAITKLALVALASSRHG